MEGYADEKIQENSKVETEGEGKRVVVNFVEEEEINPEISSSKDIDVLEDSVKESNETNLEKKIEVTKDGENKNELSVEKDAHSVRSVDEFDSVVEASVENSKDSEVSGVKVDEIKEKVLSLDESDKGEHQAVSSETNEIKAHLSEERNDLSSDVIDVVAEEIVETNLPSSADAVWMETDEKALQTSHENVAVSSVSADERSRETEVEKVLPSTEKSEETSHSVDAGTVENVEDPSKPEANVPGIRSNDGFPESVENTPIISLRQRIVQRTSWRSCCGLFEVLRRSDR